jgi:hypothetical protein
MYGGVHIKGTPWLELTRLLLFVLSLLKPPWCHIIVLYLLSYLMQIMFELRRGLIVVRVLYCVDRVRESCSSTSISGLLVLLQ